MQFAPFPRTPYDTRYDANCFRHFDEFRASRPVIHPSWSCRGTICSRLFLSSILMFPHVHPFIHISIFSFIFGVTTPDRYGRRTVMCQDFVTRPWTRTCARTYAVRPPALSCAKVRDKSIVRTEKLRSVWVDRRTYAPPRSTKTRTSRCPPMSDDSLGYWG